MLFIVCWHGIDDCYFFFFLPFSFYSCWRASRRVSPHWTFLPYQSGETLISEMCWNLPISSTSLSQMLNLAVSLLNLESESLSFSGRWWQLSSFTGMRLWRQVPTAHSSRNVEKKVEVWLPTVSFPWKFLYICHNRVLQPLGSDIRLYLLHQLLLKAFEEIKWCYVQHIVERTAPTIIYQVGFGVRRGTLKRLVVIKIDERRVKGFEYHMKAPLLKQREQESHWDSDYFGSTSQLDSWHVFFCYFILSPHMYNFLRC